MMTAKKKKAKPFNENWEAEIAAYDEEFRRREKEFQKNHVTIKESGSKKLTVDENKILTLYLHGASCEEIAKQNDVDVEIVTGLLEIIRAKLSLED